MTLTILETLGCHIAKHYALLNVKLKLTTTPIILNRPDHKAIGHQYICFHLFPYQFSCLEFINY